MIGSFVRDHGGVPSFLDYRGYPFNSCISVNDVVVHGFPGANELKEGDVVSIDIGIILNSWHGDHAYTFAIGNPGEAISKLIKVTKESLYKGIEKAVAGNRIGDIAFAIQEHTERKNGYGVVRALVGHGLGKNLHEDPQVPNYGKRGSGPKLKEGLVLAIEPMINLGTKDVYTEEDGWTVRTKDGKPSVHFEHDVCVRKLKADILSDYEIIEAAEKSNSNLYCQY
jgi:methionyl aminopeptidase